MRKSATSHPCVSVLSAAVSPHCRSWRGLFPFSSYPTMPTLTRQSACVARMLWQQLDVLSLLSVLASIPFSLFCKRTTTCALPSLELGQAVGAAAGCRHCCCCSPSPLLAHSHSLHYIQLRWGLRLIEAAGDTPHLGFRMAVGRGAGHSDPNPHLSSTGF